MLILLINCEAERAQCVRFSVQRPSNNNDKTQRGKDPVQSWASVGVS